MYLASPTPRLSRTASPSHLLGRANARDNRVGQGSVNIRAVEQLDEVRLRRVLAYRIVLPIKILYIQLIATREIIYLICTPAVCAIIQDNLECRKGTTRDAF